MSQACVSSQHCLKAAFKLLFDVTYLIHLIGLKHIAIGSLFPAVLFPISKILAHQHRLAKSDLASLHNALSIEVSEFLRNLRQIRLSSMEELWQQRVIRSRARELGQIWHCGMILAILTLVTNLGPILLISVSLSSYALEVGHLTPSLAFASIGLFRNFHAVIQDLPAMIASLQESVAASRRIELYLHQPTRVRVPNVDLASFEDASITWPCASSVPGSEGSYFSLKRVNLRFPKGGLSIITGRTSSGKGLLLSALLGEADIESSSSKAARESKAEEQTKQSTSNIAYVSQPPWIENRTIKQNIVFGDAFDEERYTAVIHACALERDFEALSAGDLTMAGVNGGALSGGQKWRVSLARALYSDARVIVLDDVLSAVDPHVARWLCQNALSGMLVLGRTVIVATHHLATCEHLASYVVTVDAGTVSSRVATPRRTNELLKIKIVPRSATSSPKPDLVVHSTDASKTYADTLKRSALQTFIVYLLGSGIRPVALAVLTTFACRLIAAGNSWWLTKWTSNTNLDSMSLRYNLFVYLALSVCAAIALAVHAMAVQAASQRASEALFQKTVEVVLQTPLRWIDNMSMGKLLQSLASDMHFIDHRVAAGQSDLLRIVMQLILVLVTRQVTMYF